MKIASIIFLFLFYNCNGNSQEINNISSEMGIGILETNTTYPIPLYKNKNDKTPVEILKFSTNKDGTTKFITNLNLNPYSLSQGDSYQKGEEQINMGLVPLSPELKFRVIDTTETFFKVIINEKNTKESYFIKIEPEKAYYKHISELFKNACSNCPNSTYNPNWNVFETWERYLKRVEYITKKDLKIYDKPNGKIIYEDNNIRHLPFSVEKIKGDWIKLKKKRGRESSFDKSNNYNGWTQWRNENEMVIDIIEYTFE